MTRQCGECTLCCRLVPVQEGVQLAGGGKSLTFDKPAGVRCQYARHAKGCSIYPTRPKSCRLWSCLWLRGEDTGARPDRAHYIFDPAPDYIVVTDNQTGEQRKVPVVQIWVDTQHRDAHRSPALRAYLEARVLPAIIRYGRVEGFILFPPSVAGRWVEHATGFNEPEHSAQEIAAAIAEGCEP